MDRAVVGLCVLLYLQLTLQAGRSTTLINRCYALCDHEVQAKAACLEERNCRMFLPDLDEFIDCTEPCNSIGNHCFQRCALGTDHITSQCHELCGDSDSCFHDCYTHLLNQKINTLYQKKKPKRMDREID